MLRNRSSLPYRSLCKADSAMTIRQMTQKVPTGMSLMEFQIRQIKRKNNDGKAASAT